MVIEFKMKSIGFNILTACLLSLFLLPCISQASDKELARAKFEEGIALFAKEEYPAALTIFEKSYVLRKSNTVLYNIAMCQRALFMHVEAIQSFRKYLNLTENKITTKEKTEIVGWINGMKKKVVKLMILEAPQGSTIFVDGDAVADTPLNNPLLLNQGDHAIEVRKDGYLSFATDVTALKGGEITLNTTLEAITTSIRVDCEDLTANVTIDGKPVGKCNYQGGIAPGSHRIRVEAQGKETLEKSVTVAQGSSATVAVTLGANQSIAQVTQTEEKPSALVMPAVVAPKKTDDGKSLKIAGIVIAGLGVVSGIVGGVFTYKYVDDRATADGARDRYNASDNPSQEDEDAYHEAMDKLSPDKAGMALGYIGAGVLVTTGLILIGVGSSKDDSKVAFAPTLGGFSVTF